MAYELRVDVRLIHIDPPAELGGRSERQEVASTQATVAVGEVQGHKLIRKIMEVTQTAFAYDPEDPE